MAIREILEFPHPVLQKAAKPITKFDSSLARLAEDMIETMHAANGIGLAAPQVGESIRLIVVEIPEEEGESSTIYAVCNPEITRREGNARIEEGCLSCPELYVEVDRAKEITLKGRLPDGSPFLVEADDLLSICFQHEIDHLDGKLLVNYVSSVKRTLYKSQMKKRRLDKGKTVERTGAL